MKWTLLRINNVCAVVQVHMYTKTHFCFVIVINIFYILLNNFQSLIQNAKLSPVFMTYEKVNNNYYYFFKCIHLLFWFVVVFVLVFFNTFLFPLLLMIMLLWFTVGRTVRKVCIFLYFETLLHSVYTWGSVSLWIVSWPS